MFIHACTRENVCVCAYKQVMDNSANSCAPQMQIKVWQPGSGIFQFSTPECPAWLQ